jgi:hypothetical protein
MKANSTDRHHIDARRVDLFDIAPIDWEDIEQAATITQRILRDFAADKACFRELLKVVPDDPYLWSKCEEDVVEDKIVLWDDVEKNLRIRLRMSTARQERLAHSHRFSFSNLVLRGRYIHWHYAATDSFDARTRLDDVVTVAQHEDKAGDCFTIHHDALHSTPFTEVGTVSLVLRGNPVKDRAPVMFKESRGREEALRGLRDSQTTQSVDIEPAVAEAGTVFYRVGEKDESAQRRSERQMTRDKFNYWFKQLEDWQII